jgi:septum formation protein
MTGIDLMKRDILLLGSQSSSRQDLLHEAAIPFISISHRSTELETVFGGDLEAYVIAIARHKMASLILPTADELGRDTIIVLTADSMVQHQASGKILGKPQDEADAARMLALARTSEMLIMTGCCLYQYVWQDGVWFLKRERVWATPAYVEFIVQENELAYYFARLPQAMYSAGAGILEGFGANYLKSVRGSFSGGRGLPMFELRAALADFGFKFQ